MKQQFVLLTEGAEDFFRAKTAVSFMRYRPSEIVACLDAGRVGKKVSEEFGVDLDLPFVKSISDVQWREGDGDPKVLVLGIAPPGGGLPEAWRKIVLESIENGCEIWSGLHIMLEDDTEFSTLAAKKGVRIWDARRSPADLSVPEGKIFEESSFRVLTVGTDCNLGKKVTGYSLVDEMVGRGLDSVFIPTGQSGIMLEGWGIAIDTVVSDFMAGAMEKLLLHKKDHDFQIVEGQGGILQPMYSGVTLGLLHGTLPDAMVLCHEATRTEMRYCGAPMPPLSKFVGIYEDLMNDIYPSRVVAVSMNTVLLDEKAAIEAVKNAEEESGLPATDPLRFGAKKLVDAVMKYYRNHPKGGGSSES